MMQAKTLRALRKLCMQDTLKLLPPTTMLVLNYTIIVKSKRDDLSECSFFFILSHSGEN